MRVETYLQKAKQLSDKGVKPVKCKYCNRNRGGRDGICDGCRKKMQPLREHRIFRTDEEAERAKPISERRPQPRGTCLERPDTYKKANHKIGSDTKKLIDFVNKSGTIHYGRYVAEMMAKER